MEIVHYMILTLTGNGTYDPRQQGYRHMGRSNSETFAPSLEDVITLGTVEFCFAKTFVLA